MDSPIPLLEALAGVLAREEAALTELLRQADATRDALIASDFAALESANRSMQSSTSELLRLGRERETLLVSFGGPGATLNDALALASELGLSLLEVRRQRLAATASLLQQAQERNARLVLGAVRLRERWFNMLAGMISPTYGSAGRQNPAASRRFVSKTA